MSYCLQAILPTFCLYIVIKLTNFTFDEYWFVNLSEPQHHRSDEWKVSLKERKQSAKVRERVPPVGASAEQSHDELSARG